LKPIFGDLEKEELYLMAEEMDADIKGMHRRLMKAVVEQNGVSPELISSKLIEVLNRAVV